MKIYISADIEGIGCVVRSEHWMTGGREYEFARRQMTDEVNAAVRAAFDAGATEVVVSDAHNVGINLIPDRLDERVRIVMGSPSPLGMMSGVDLGFDAVFLVGYHAMAGTAAGCLAHTYAGSVDFLELAGRRVGEIGLSAVIAGHYGAPVVLVTGDGAACAEARALLPGVETAEVKQSLSSHAGICLHPKRAAQAVYEAAARAMGRIGTLAPFALQADPIPMRVRFADASMVDRTQRLPGGRREDGRTMAYDAPGVPGMVDAFLALVDLAARER